MRWTNTVGGGVGDPRKIYSAVNWIWGTMQHRRSYAEEMALAIDKAMSANHDRNPNRYAEVNGWLQYGQSVAIARRGHEPIPPRPDGRFV